MQLYTEHWPNSLTTDLVLRLADERFESVAEARFFYLCFRWSVPMPQPQYVVEDRAGLSVARLDFAWPARKRWVEVDGRVKYEKLLREGERASDVVLREKRRAQPAYIEERVRVELGVPPGVRQVQGHLLE